MQSVSNIATPTRDENLQILRFIAAALVLVTHITFYLHERINTSVSVWHSGEIGVPIFFIISGFVMYLSGLKTPRNVNGAKIFITRRIARIFPIYWLITTAKIAIALIVPAVVLHNQPNFLSSLAAYTLFPVFNEAGEVRPIHGVAWTLLHEMMFYYIFSIALILRQSPFIFSSIVIIALWFIGFFIHPTSALLTVLFDPINLMFVSGMLLAAAYNKGIRLPQWLASTLFFVSCFAIFSADFSTFKHLYISSFHIDAVLLVAAMLNMRIFAPQRLKALLVRLGDSSYSLYLIHPILAPAICIALSKMQFESPFLISTIAFISIVVAAELTFKFIESPLNTKALKFFQISSKTTFISSKELNS